MNDFVYLVDHREESFSHKVQFKSFGSPVKTSNFLLKTLKDPSQPLPFSVPSKLLIFIIMVFERISICVLPTQKELDFLGGGGFWKTKKFKEMCEALFEFPEGWGVLKKILSIGEVWICSGTTHNC